MSLLLQIGNFFLNPKAKAAKNIAEAKRIKLTSQIATVSLVIAVFYHFVFLSFNDIRLTLSELVFIFCYFLVLVLNFVGYSSFSKFFLIATFYVNFFVISAICGEEACVHLLYIPALTAPLILLDFAEIKLIVLLVIIAFLCLITLYILNFVPSLTIQISAKQMYNLKFSFILTSMVGQFIVIYSMIFKFTKTEKKLDMNNVMLEEQFKSIFDTSFDALFIVEYKERRIIKANSRAVELFEMENEYDFYLQNGLDLRKEPIGKKEHLSIKGDIAVKGFHENEVLYKTKKGNEFWGALAIRLVFMNGMPYQSVRITDITDQKKIEKQIQTSLNEKEILLAEIHHRVKNNLAVISGLLGLQANYVEDEKAKVLFEESRNRIHSMALIHDKLYQNETLATINFSEYIHDLVEHIKKSYIPDTWSVKFNITCNEIFLDIRNAVPCGLILNELISNSCKHAFKDIQNPEIKIVCSKMGEKFTMMVSDNGIGFDIENGFKRANSLGLTLIQALSEQLGGKVNTTFVNGTQFYISFEV